MDKRPNILWLCTDQQRWDTIHALGNSFIDTPNLDRLCRQGVAFTNTYCQNPICTPSRASFLTGRYPSSINANINGACNLPEHCTLITKSLLLYTGTVRLRAAMAVIGQLLRPSPAL